jgi:hypothetical protein
VVSVVAPAGYGKTTLLAQWAQRKGGRVGWLTVDPHDNDPAVLLTYLAVALDRVASLEPETFKILASPSAHVPPAVVPRLAAAMSATTEPVALVLDHVELLDNRQCLDALAQLALQLAGDSQLALASRTQPRLPLGRLRGQGRLMEVGAADLAMDSSEARALLEGAEVRLPGEDAAELHRRTEGWPVGLYLAALALRGGLRRGRPVRRRLPERGAAGATSRQAGVVPHPDGRAGPDVRPAVRRGPGHDRLGHGAGVARRVQISSWSLSTADGSGTATTTCSATCSVPSSGGASPSWSRSCTGGPRPGARPTGWRRRPSTTPRPPATPTRWRGWSCG